MIALNYFFQGILLFATSQNQASLQSREIVDILRIHNMYRRMFANGAYSVDVGDMKKLVSMACLLEKKSRRVCTLSKILFHEKTVISFATVRVYKHFHLSLFHF